MSMFNNGSRGGRDGGNSGLPSAPPTMAQAAGGKRGMFSVIGSDMVITGNVAATADLHIDGRVEGDIACGNFVQGNDSYIKGAVRAESARAARITGDVEYESIAIETGASIDGRLKHIAADAGTNTFDRTAPASVLATPREDVVTIVSDADA